MIQKKSYFWLHKISPLLALLGVMLLVALACSLPSQNQAEDGPLSTGTADTDNEQLFPTLPPPPTPTPQPLPPTLVEVKPASGSEIELHSNLIFYFNQPMDRGSVEGALVGQPELSGNLDWVDDATLIFEPDAPFPS